MSANEVEAPRLAPASWRRPRPRYSARPNPERSLRCETAT